MSLVAQWEHIQNGLSDTWANVQLVLRVDDDGSRTRAAALLGPLQPGRSGGELRFQAARHGAGPSPGAVRRALTRLDEERITGTLELLGSGEPAPVQAADVPPAFAGQWDAALAGLPPDWSDVYAEVRLTSSDDLDPAALALSPVNPARFGETLAFRFRCARTTGYGASPVMVRRCLERLDERGTPGTLEIEWALSDTRHVGTQGPVWYVGGKVV